MKIVSPAEITELEKLSIEQGCSQLQFMKNAGLGVAQEIDGWMKERKCQDPIFVFVGKGNNGGDASCCSGHLIHFGYQVTVVSLYPENECSSLCQLHLKEFKELGGPVLLLENIEALSIPSNAVIVDGIFGIGFKGPLTPFIISVIEKINQCKQPCFSIDIPSGLDAQTGMPSPLAVIATYTFYLEYPKTGFFLGLGWNHVGILKQVCFGLPSQITCEGKFQWHSLQEIASFLPALKRNAHKYQRGYVVGIAGSDQMPGSAMLAAQASLRAGSGIVRLYTSVQSWQQLGASCLEILRGFFETSHFADLKEQLARANALFIGPGLGAEKSVLKATLSVMQKWQGPAVIDADALSLFASSSLKGKGWILTPHTGEMARLLGMSLNHPPLTLDFLNSCQQFSNSRECYILLKGAPTFLFSPHEIPSIITVGTPGMATAGTGDVLCGIIAGLLAQKCPPFEAALLGATLHGLAGEKAACELTDYCLCASDLSASLPQAFKQLIENKK